MRTKADPAIQWHLGFGQMNVWILGLEQKLSGLTPHNILYNTQRFFGNRFCHEELRCVFRIGTSITPVQLLRN